MRIVWNEQENYFQAEIVFVVDQWREEIDTLKLAGFKYSGDPSRQWYATKASALNKLRKNPPKSGILITELALEKYKKLNEQEETNAALKKEFKKLQKAVGGPFPWREELDPGTGVVCAVIPSVESEFKLDYTPPAPPDALCFICDRPVYFFEYPDLCLWCSKQQEKA